MTNINVEGVILPNVPLSNFQMLDVAKELKIKNMRGVFVRDELPKRPKKVECGILNLDNSQGMAHTGLRGLKTAMKNYTLIVMGWHHQLNLLST